MARKETLGPIINSSKPTRPDHKVWMKWGPTLIRYGQVQKQDKNQATFLLSAVSLLYTGYASYYRLKNVLIPVTFKSIDI